MVASIRNKNTNSGHKNNKDLPTFNQANHARHFVSTAFHRASRESKNPPGADLSGGYP